MSFDKTANRKSRAPWQSAHQANPYANANTSVMSENSTHNPYQQSTLQVPLAPVPPAIQSRKNTRRLSIHASAMGNRKDGPPGFDPLFLPPVPTLPRGKMGNDAVLIASSVEEDEFANIKSKIMNELSQGTASEIDDYFKVLTKQKTLINRDIKNNINQNQKHILELTNDLKDTQEELLKLRISTKELYSVFDEFKQAAERRLALEHEEPAKPERTNSRARLALPNKRKDRSSVLVLEKMWVNELQSLFKHVDGASKFIQAIPGRHILAESGRWFEVNVGTWKQTKSIHIFILNDLVLVALRKSSSEMASGNTTSNKRLQAMHCWPLNHVKFSEIPVPIADSKHYGVSIKSKSASYVYTTDRYDHYLKIMDAYNKGTNELLQRDRLLDARKSINGLNGISETSDEKRQLRDSLKASMELPNLDEKSHKRLSSDIVLQDISARVHSRNRSHDFSKAFDPNAGDDKVKHFTDLKGIEDKLDEVDVHIAHNKYYECVGLANHIENKLAAIENTVRRSQTQKEEINLLIDVIKLKIEGRKVKIQQYLEFDLQHNISRMGSDEVLLMIEFFQNFGQLHKGIQTYLQAMSSYLASTLAKLVVGVQGSTRIDIVNYLSNLVIIHISIVKRAITVYRDKITPIIKRTHQDVDSSGFISWCMDEMTKLLVSVKKHLYGTLINVDVDPETEVSSYTVKDAKYFKEFLGVIVPQLNDLKTVGVNVDFLFEDVILLGDSL